MFYLRYIGAELRHRVGRTALTALGLAVGVGLVVTVTALSRGLDAAQEEVLEPLTGVGTEITVRRPISTDEAGISAEDQRQLREENGAPRLGLTGLAEPGERFEHTDYLSTDLSFSDRERRRVAGLDGVDATAGGLTVDVINVSGKVPEDAGTGGPTAQLAPPGAAAQPGAAGPQSIGFDRIAAAGIDASSPDLGALTADQVVEGRYLRAGARDEAVISTAYAERESIELGDEVELGGKELGVVGISEAPLAGEPSDVYLPLATLQRLSDREGRINVLAVDAASTSAVAGVAGAIESSFDGAEATTADELTEQVEGSLVDAGDLADKLGLALAVVALGAAFGTAALLTLSSVNKRTRELGTLKAIGWGQGLVVRQVSGEAVVQGLLGGALGILLGIGGVAAINAIGITLEATAAASGAGAGPAVFAGPAGAPPGGGPPAGGPLGGAAAEPASSAVELGASIDLQLVLLALGLAVLGGLVAGAAGGLRAARLHPAEALRSAE